MSDEAARPSGPALPRCPHCNREHAGQLLKCPDTDMPLPLEGRVLHGKFRFIQQIGKGGMASVWAAVNTLVDRRVAIKLIRPEAGRNEETVARFRAEAKAAGRIGHPNVCEIIDFGLGPLGPYIVMERLWGKSLGELIAEQTRLDPALAAGIIRQALSGLEAAHRRGIIHRDLKPENLFIHQPEAGPPAVKIMDFGVSKFVDGSSGVQTGHGALLGTPEYMSPEQFKGAAAADVRTDVWAVGAILYKALTGKSAFAGPTVAATLLMVTTDAPTPIDELVRGVPPDLVALVERCLDKDPEARFASAQELSDELESFDLHTLEALVVAGPREREDEEAPALPTVAVSPISVPIDTSLDDDDDGDSGTSKPQAEIETLEPATHRRMLATERKPTRPERRAWLLIGGVTVVGAGLLYMLARGPSAESETHDAAAVARTSADTPQDPRGQPKAAHVDAVIAASGSASGSADGPPGESTTGTASTSAAALGSSTGEAPDPDLIVDSTGPAAPSPTTTDTDAATGPDATADGPAAPAPGDDGPATPDPQTPAPPDPSRGSDDGATDTEAPPPTPPGTIRVGRYLTLEKRGPTVTHDQARAYCRNLAKQSFVGVSVWKLASPTVARKLATHVKKGKYWTAALWNGKAIVITLPSKKTDSRAAKKSGPRALCSARWP